MTDPIVKGDFEVVGPARRGPAGIVYRAKRRSTGEIVGLLEIEIEGITAEALQCYIADAHKLRGLRHPNVLEVGEVGTFSGNPFLVLSLPEAQPMTSALPCMRLELRHRIELMLQVAQGLREIHLLGIVHRAVSTQGVILHQSTAVVAEPGLPRHTNWSQYESRTREILRTDGNVAPEQIIGKEATVASDIFAFGALFYEVVSGGHPFQAEHLVSMLHNIVHGTPRPLQDQVPDCPAGLAALVAQCLRKDPAERPQDMGMVVRALEDALAGEELVRPGGTLPLPRPEHSEHVRSRDTHPRSIQPHQNPYLNRTMIRRFEDFVGRTQEVKRIYARLNASPPVSVSVVGDRKIGKSSLLNFVYMQTNRNQWLADPSHTVMLFIDLQQEKDMTIEAFIRVLLQTAKLELGESFDLDSLDHNLEGLRQMVRRLDREGFRLVVILDEFERITGSGKFPLEFFSFLRHLANHYNVAYLTSSSKDLQSLCHDRAIADSPFFNIFTAMHLSAMTRDEALELIRAPSQGTCFPLGAYSAEILAMSGLFPYFIQLACSHTLEFLEEGQRLDWGEVSRRFYQEAQSHYRFLWEGLDWAEREALRRIARDDKIPQSLAHVVEKLHDRGYVMQQDAKPRLFARPFTEFVRRVTKESTRLGGRHRRALVLLTAIGVLVAGVWAIEVRLGSHAGTRGEPRSVRTADSTGGTHLIPGQHVNLRLLSIGVSKYVSSDYALAYSDDDAKALVAAFQDQKTLFDVDSQLLVNENATKANILKQLRRLRTVAMQHDLVVLTLSGHGEVDEGGQFFFLPYDFKPDEEFGVSAISKQDFLGYLANIPCPVLVLLDTCHSGEFARGSFRGGAASGSMDRAVRSAIEEFSRVDKGIVVMAACLSQESAEESSSWKHGALTLAFLEAIRGRHLYERKALTELPSDSIMTLSDLDYYVTKRVNELVGGSQRVKTANLDDLSLRSITIAVHGSAERR